LSARVLMRRCEVVVVFIGLELDKFSSRTYDSFSPGFVQRKTRFQWPSLRSAVATTLRDVFRGAQAPASWFWPLAKTSLILRTFGGSPNRTSLLKILQKKTKIRKKLQSWTCLLKPLFPLLPSVKSEIRIQTSDIKTSDSSFAITSPEWSEWDVRHRRQSDEGRSE
jgi:hypothetical protein